MQPLKGCVGHHRLAVLWMEITDRRKSQVSPLEHEHHWLALTEHARDIITVAARDGRLHFISGGVKNSLGYSAEERRSHSIFEHVHADDVEALRAKYAQLVSGAIPGFSHHYRISHKDGSLRWLESHYASALANPLIKCVVINSRDITERRQAELRLAQREEVFRLAADAVNGIIFEWDLAAGWCIGRAGVHEVLGIEPDDLAAAGAWSARIHPQDDADYRQRFARRSAATRAAGRPRTAFGMRAALIARCWNAR